MNISSEIKIYKSKEFVLRIIKSANNLEKFHPYCIKNDVENWNNENSVDYVHYYSGKIYKRKFIKWNDDGYVLEIYEDRKLATITWSVNGNGKSSNIKISAKLLLPYKSRFINGCVFHFYVKFVLKTYLNSVVKGLKYYSETNNVVIKDQFGKHVWFSEFDKNIGPLV